MTTDDLDTPLRPAVLNNALFCHAVCRAHGLPADFDDESLWLSTSRTPPLYPDAVTLGPGAPEEGLLRRMDTDSPGCSVKDSFADLDLEGDGFEVLFDAQWIHRPAGAPTAGAPSSGLEWSEVAGGGELALWEAAWDGEESTGLFRPVLLGEEIAFLAGRRDGRIVAGAALNLAAGVVGVSNLFAHDDADTDAAWTGALAAAAARWPGRDVVGYESGDDLATAVRHGFTPIGPLRVWLRTSERTRRLDVQPAARVDRMNSAR
ncbi:hypothetical protein [Streptomyces sp. NPDC096339]|uniref:hypothetical protein n=1 Tax=Streptomyces sp. NPDC096339 TaxID=3366086 RepID=UPI0037F9AEEF